MSTKEQVEPLLDGAMRFIAFVKTYLAENAGLEKEKLD